MKKLKTAEVKEARGQAKSLTSPHPHWCSVLEKTKIVKQIEKQMSLKKQIFFNNMSTSISKVVPCSFKAGEGRKLWVT